jgi:hypothetical protein
MFTAFPPQIFLEKCTRTQAGTGEGEMKKGVKHEFSTTVTSIVVMNICTGNCFEKEQGC